MKFFLLKILSIYLKSFRDSLIRVEDTSDKLTKMEFYLKYLQRCYKITNFIVYFKYSQIGYVVYPGVFWRRCVKLFKFLILFSLERKTTFKHVCLKFENQSKLGCKKTSLAHLKSNE